MANDNVDITLVAKQASATNTTLDNIIKKLEKINKLSTFELGKGTGNKTAIKDYERLNAVIEKNIKLKREEVIAMRNVDTQIRSNTAQNEGFAKSAIGVAEAYKGWSMIIRTVRVLGEELRELVELDRVVFNLGVVAGKSVPEINKLRTSMLELGQTVPQTAEEIAESLDLIVRTGTVYSDALKIVDASTILATASGKICSIKIPLIAGTSYKVLDTKLRQKCA